MILFGDHVFLGYSAGRLGAGEHRILPVWFVWTGYVVGLFLLLSATISPLLILVFPIWVLVLSLLLLRQARRIPKEAKGT